jgi:hypothetical protein
VAQEKQMTEHELMLEARLLAIEYMLANVYALLHRINRSTPAQISAAHDQVKNMLRQQTVPGVDPVQSDQMFGEIQIAVERISIEEMGGAVQKKRPRDR